MPAKHNGRYFFMERQLQEYTRTIDRLRNLNCVALLKLREIGRWNWSNKRYKDAGDFFSAVAAQMILALQFLVAIRSSAQQPSGTLVEFIFSPVCGKCTASPYEGRTILVSRLRHWIRHNTPNLKSHWN